VDAEWNLVAGGSSRQFRSTFLSFSVTGLMTGLAGILPACVEEFSWNLVAGGSSRQLRSNISVLLHDRSLEFAGIC